MSNLIPIIAALHLFGSIIGTAYSTYAEIYFLKAASDGDLDKHERKYLRRLLNGLHWAVPVVVCTSVALIVLEYLTFDAPQAVLTAPFWASQTILLIVLLFGQALQRRKSPWWMASSAMVMGWWTLLCIDLGYLNNFSYVAIIMTYILSGFVIAGVVGYLRLWFWHPQHLPSAENVDKS